MKIRKFRPADLNHILQLFYDTVHTINIKDYSHEQAEAWAPKDPDIKRWYTSLNNNITYVAELDNHIVGFGDMTSEGHVDRLYTHRSFQSKGIGSRILSALEQEAKQCGIKGLTVESSITAKPFFEQKGYEVLQTQQKKHCGLTFFTFIMHKKL